MKLNSDQIIYIDQTLEANGIIYDDIKIELIDHIATDIETEMEAKKLPFEAVYEDCFNKMKPVLYKKNKLPLIIEQKVNREINILRIKTSIIALFLTLASWLFSNKNMMIDADNIIFKISIFMLLMTFFGTKIYFYKNFKKHSYTEFLKRTNIFITLFMIYFLFGTIKMSFFKQSIGSFVIVGLSFFYILILIQLIFKNIQTITKLNQQKYETK